ncbi:MAG: sugar phosphate isomerase/epimerase [Planctomycetes bacterium]|nr:sugar phosphate isomerase/epimerase [Planctomycetota bacterium]
MKLCFATLGCPDWTVDLIACRAKAMGFDGVELRGAAGNHIGPDEPAESRARIRRVFQEQDLSIACIMGYTNFATADAAQRAASLETARRLIDVAADVGCSTVRVFGGQMGDTQRAEALKRVIEGLRAASQKAVERGVRLAMETHDDWCRGENLLAVIEGVRSPALGVCWDIGNAYFVEPLDRTYAAIGRHVYHVHFKDAARETDGRVRSRLPGQGEVDMECGLNLLHQGGYTGWLSFEWEKKWEPRLAEPDVAFPHFLEHARRLMSKLGVPRG